MSLVDVRSLPPRLVDYVLIVGSSRPPASVDGVQNPKVLRRFPEEDLTDFPLPPDVVFFCQPDGCYLSRLAPAESAQQQKLFVFCLTEKDSNKRRFGVCLNFFRPCCAFEVRTASQPSDESAEADGGAQSSSLQRDNRSAEQCVPAVPPGAQFLLTSVCLLSHHGFFAAFKEILTTFRDLVERTGHDQCLRGKEFVGSDGVKVDYEALCESENGWRKIMSASKEMDVESDQDPLASDLIRWVNRLLEAPVPIPGQSRIELELAVLPTLTLAYPDKTRFALLDFPLHLPLDLLGPELMARVISVVLLEQKVLFQSRDYNILSMCVMAVVAMLFPLEYLFPVIPILPTSMPNAETLLLAPSPYLIGVPASFLNPRRGIMLPEDVFLVDIDSGRMDEPTNTSLPDPPPRVRQVLKQRLEKALHALHNPVSSPKRSSIDSAPRSPKGASTGRFSPMPAGRFSGFYSLMQHQASDGSCTSSDSGSDEDEEKDADCLDGLFPLMEYDIVAVDIFIRVTMVKFLYSAELLANYSRFLRPIRLHSRPVVILQKTAFLKSIRDGASPFLVQLADTQALEAFGEFDLNPSTTVHRRILQGMVDPSAIGDKEKYFKDSLSCLKYSVFEPCYSLGGALEAKAVTYPSDSSSSDEGSLSSEDDSSNSSSLILITDDEEEEEDQEEEEEGKEEKEEDKEEQQVAVVRRRIINTSGQKQSAAEIIRSARKFLNTGDSPGFVKEDAIVKTVPPLVINTAAGRKTLDDLGSNNKSKVDPSSTATGSSSSSESPTHRSGDAVMPKTTALPTQNSLTMDSSWNSVSSQPVVSVTTERGKAYRQVRVTSRQLYRNRSSLDEVSTPFHSQRRRMESNYRRRPSPLRTRSLSFNTPVYLSTGLVHNDNSIQERRASDVKLRQNYDEAVFGGLLGRGDHKQEMQALSMEARWLKSHKNYDKPLRPVYNPFPTTRKSVIDPALFGLTPRRSPSSNFFLGQAKDAMNTRENRKFISELTNGVLDGRGVPWYHKRKMERLLLTEAMRMVVVNALSEVTGVSSSPNSVPDVWLCKPVYKGVLVLLKAILAGVENTVEKGFQEPIASAYHLLELAYSHFTGTIQDGELAEVSSPPSDEAQRRSLRPVSPAVNTSPRDSELGTHPEAPSSPFEEIMLTELVDVSPPSTLTSPIEATDDGGEKLAQASQDQQLEWSRAQSVDFSALRTTDSVDSPETPNRRPFFLPPQAMSPEQRERHEHLISAATAAATSAALNEDQQPEVIAYPHVFNRRKEGIKHARPHGNIIKPGVNAEHYVYVGGEVVRLDTLTGKEPVKSPGAEEKSENTASLSCNQRHYLYEELLGKGNVRLWDNMEFWETLFSDLVLEERFAMGLTEDPVQLIERYRRLSSIDRQYLEHEEDLALTGLLVNMAAFMVAMKVSHSLITNKVRRLVGRAHIGLQFSQHVYDILKVLQAAKGNAFELWPLRSRQLLRQDFMVHQGDDMSGETLMIEVSDLAIRVVVVGRGTKHRWFYEDIVRANYHPVSGVLCLWVREEEGVIPYNFCAKKKGRQLYKAVEAYINDSSAPVVFGNSISGQFPVRDGENGDSAILTLSISGISCKFTSNRPHHFISVTDILNCSADGNDFLVNVLEESGAEKQYHFISVQVSQIIQTMMNIFSVVSAQEKARRESVSSGQSWQSLSPGESQPPALPEEAEASFKLEGIDEVELESHGTPPVEKVEDDKTKDEIVEECEQHAAVAETNGAAATDKETVAIGKETGAMNEGTAAESSQ